MSQGYVNEAVKELKRMRPGLTPDDIKRFKWWAGKQTPEQVKEHLHNLRVLYK